LRVFLAGSTGVIGKSLLPLLLEKKHEVFALIHTPQKAKAVEELGARTVIADALNRDELTEAIRKTEPEVIIHELTSLSGVTGSFRKFDREFALTNRFRTEVTDTMLAAAGVVRARRFIGQSFCGWPFAREGWIIKTEEDPLDASPPASFRKTLEAIRYLENAIIRAENIEALALRYGLLYGEGTGFARDGAIVRQIRKCRIPIIGEGAGVWSFIHVDDAARATLAAVSRGNPGIYNIVDDTPAPVSTWLPELAKILDAKPPYRIPVWLGGLMIGEGGVSMMTKIRGGSNAKAKRDLGWKPVYSDWRKGFAKELG
jgi:nucleoside-diphosphate-sugar epimerase